MKNFLPFLGFFLLLSCNKTHPDEQYTSENRRYSVRSIFEKSSSFFYVEDDTKSDSLILFIRKDSFEVSTSIYISNSIKSKIIKCVKYHLDQSNFNSNQKSMEENRNRVVFFIDNSEHRFLGNRGGITFESRFVGLNSNRDVSENYDSLILFLKKEYKEFKDW